MLRTGNVIEGSPKPFEHKCTNQICGSVKYLEKQYPAREYQVADNRINLSEN